MTSLTVYRSHQSLVWEDATVGPQLTLERIDFVTADIEVLKVKDVLK